MKLSKELQIQLLEIIILGQKVYRRFDPTQYPMYEEYRYRGIDFALAAIPCRYDLYGILYIAGEALDFRDVDFDLDAVVERKLREE